LTSPICGWEINECQGEISEVGGVADLYSRSATVVCDRGVAEEIPDQRI